MTTNLGKLDRGLRLVAAALLVILAFGTEFAASGIAHWLALVVAAVVALTALMGSCPLYRVIGFKTCHT
jgi:hypothetical protein